MCAYFWLTQESPSFIRLKKKKHQSCWTKIKQIRAIGIRMFGEKDKEKINCNWIRKWKISLIVLAQVEVCYLLKDLLSENILLLYKKKESGWLWEESGLQTEMFPLMRYVLVR